MLRPYVGPEELQTMTALEGGLHCPRCAASLSDRGFASAFWAADSIVYFCWCGACAWLGEIWEIHAVTSHEVIEEPERGEQPRLGVVQTSGEVGGLGPRRRG